MKAMAFSDYRDTRSTDELDLDLLEDLEHQTLDNVARLRTHERISLRIKILLSPGNLSELVAAPLEGFTKDLSQGGCAAVFPVAPRVGDLYRVQLVDEQRSLPQVIARCRRCAMIRDDAFQCGFEFISQLAVEELLDQDGSSSLLD